MTHYPQEIKPLTPAGTSVLPSAKVCCWENIIKADTFTFMREA